MREKGTGRAWTFVTARRESMTENTSHLSLEDSDAT
jgi:hypothetical protein